MNVLISSPRLFLVAPLTLLAGLVGLLSSRGHRPGLFDSYDDARAQLRGFSGGKFRGYDTSGKSSKALADWSTAFQCFSFSVERPELRIYTDGSASAAGTPGASAGWGFHAL